MKQDYAVVPSLTAEAWVYNVDLVTDAIDKYITHHPRLFDPEGNVILENIEMANLILAREELGLSKDDMPEELVVGIVPRQVGTITKRGSPPPESMKNSLLIGTANEIVNAVLGAFRAYYNIEEAKEPKSLRFSKTPKERAEERRRKRRRNR